MTGLCKCGCGARTRVPAWNNAARGWRAGVPLDYIRGHNGPPPPRPEPPAIRFWAKVDRRSDGCWTWQAYVGRDGYGRFAAGRPVLAHRFAWTLLRGPIPDGLQLDHLCRNRRCVRPDHLEPVTPLENVRRGQGHGSESQCPRGHAYAGANLHIRRDGRRTCRACDRARGRRRRRMIEVGR